RRILRAAIVAVAAVAGAAAYAVWFWPAGSTAPADYGTVAVDRGPIEQVVNATGTVNPVTTVQVGTYVSGPIQALDVWFNSPVKKGQRVAKIDPAPFAVKVREAEASLKNAQAKVVGDRADTRLKKLLLERNRTLLARNLVAQNDLDTAETANEQASAQLALDQAGQARPGPPHPGARAPLPAGRGRRGRAGREAEGGERRLRPRAGRRAPARRGAGRGPRQPARRGTGRRPARGGPGRRRPAT